MNLFPLITGLVFACLSSIPLASAHPVIHQGGTAVSSFNTNTLREWSISHSIASRLAFGIRYFNWNHLLSTHGTSTTVAIRALRWNGENGQANFYLSGGAGAESSYEGANLFGWLSPEIDWENRSILTSLKFEYFPGLFNRPRNMTRGRIGFAAYEGVTDGINAWMVVEGEYHSFDPADSTLPTFHASQNIQNWLITPMLRLTYQNVLLETGVSQNGAIRMNFETHF